MGNLLEHFTRLLANNAAPRANEAPPSELSYKVGETVEARATVNTNIVVVIVYDYGGQFGSSAGGWVLGTISRDLGNGSYDILYNDGDKGFGMCIEDIQPTKAVDTQRKRSRDQSAAFDVR